VALTVEEASETYISEMRNVLPPGTGICATCKTFVGGQQYSKCYSCNSQPSLLDTVVPITYSAHLGQIHTALRTYKEPRSADAQRFASIRLTAILWRFLEAHEACIAAATGIERFSVVTTVPSSSRERDERGSLRQIVGIRQRRRSTVSRCCWSTTRGLAAATRSPRPTVSAALGR
jgi:hypothetical protein